MERIKTYLLGFSVTVSAMILLVAVIMAIVLNSGALNSLAKNRITDSFNSEFKGTLTIDKLDLQFPSKAVLHEPSIATDATADPVIAARTIAIDLNFLRLMFSDFSGITIRSLKADRLNISIETLPDGTTSLQKVFSPAVEKNDEDAFLVKRFLCGKLQLTDSALSLHSAPGVKGAYPDFSITGLQTVIKKLLYTPESISATLQQLSCSLPHDNITLKSASADLFFNNEQSSVLDLKVVTGQSRIDGSFSLSDFNIFTPENWKNFSNSRAIADIRHLELHTDDMVAFAPDLPLPAGLYSLNAQAGGVLRKLLIETAVLRHNDSMLSLKGELLNVNQPEFLAFNLESDSARISQGLAETLVRDTSFSVVLQALGPIDLSGGAYGDLKEFSSDLQFSTDAGSGGIHLKTGFSEKEPVSYRGDFFIANTEAYRFFPIDSTSAGMLNIAGTIEGKGVLPQPESLHIDANLENSFWKEQQIDNGSIALDYRKKILRTTVDLNEKATHADIDATIDWNAPSPIFSLQGTARKLDISKVLGLDQISSDLNGSFSCKGESFDPEQLKGSISVLFDTSRINNYMLPEGSKATASIKRLGENSTVTINSDFLDFSAEGTYTFREFLSGITFSAASLQNEIRKNNIWLSENQDLEPEVPHDFSAKYRLDIRDSSPLAIVLPLEGYLFSGSASGTAESRNGTLQLKSSIEIRKVSRDSSFAAADARMDLTMNSSAGHIHLASLSVQAAALRFNNRDYERIDLATSWKESLLSTSLTLHDRELEQDLAASITARRIRAIYELTVNSFTFGSGTDSWTIPAGSRADIGRNYTQLYDIRLKKAVQSISCTGMLSNDLSGEFNCTIKNFDMQELEAFALAEGLHGTLSSTLKVAGSPGTKKAEINLNGSDIIFNEITLGNLHLKASHSKKQLRFELNTGRETPSGKTNDIRGRGTIPLELTYSPPGYSIPENQSITIVCESDNLSAEFLELILPFFKTAEGTIPAKLTVTGKTPEPDIYFSTTFNKTAITVTPTETTYELTGAIEVTPQKASFKAIAIVDSLGGKGTINGSADIENLEIKSLDLKASFKNLLLFNKKDKRDETSFGTISGTSNNLSFYGPVSQPVLTGSLNITNADFTLYRTGSNESTKYIGIENFITFVPRYPEESVQQAEQNGPQTEENPEFQYSLLDIVRIQNLQLKSNVELRYNMVFDRIRGEKLETTLQNLSLLVKKHQQNYELFGSVNVSAGKYYFSNTSFDLDDGGKIVWNNVDIRDGEMENLFGRKYIIATDPLSGETDNVRLLLAIEGTLNTPDIQMGYYLNDESQPFASETMIGTQSSKIDPNAEINTVSLLLTKQWYIRPGSQAAGNKTIPFSSVGISTGTGLISSQLSRLIQQASGLESFNVNLAVDDQGDYSGLDFSFALIVPGTEGKMRFLGTASSSNTQETELFNYYGNNQRIEYRITPKVFFEAYRSYGLFGNDVTTTNLLKPAETYGISLSYRERFYDWGEFWNSVFGGDKN
ncbi:conserved hypothetical protein [Prosthecochloris aestuarii DSM 271]|uniref:Translocation and assembly module TamB C-terminal domain-containing protein n=2 Tax=Prosthecochloris aestuarii TaxID=1102 RepID=B4S4F0_PROA2|nr:conserved hypothetical protein [Prosthecochloris aestuarii DSM 271]